MSKAVTIFFIFLAIILIAYNVTWVNFESPFDGNSLIALIGIVASLCAIVLLLIFMTSKKIQEKKNS